jgi:putative Mg2+ transporter-C (MgtC) family protein
MELAETLLATLRLELADLMQIEHLLRSSVRLLLAMLLGGLLGYERQATGKAAGVRTHMLVCLGASIFVMTLEQEGAAGDAMSRVVQGVATGIGFLCAGTILKGTSLADVKGLTTAAGLWSSAAIGVAVGSGREAIAMLATLLVWMVLRLMPRLVDSSRKNGRRNAKNP